MDDLALQEQLKYDRIWTSIPEYRIESPADYLTPVFLRCFHTELHQGETVIDFGCGPGRSALPLLQAGLKVHLVDICENCLDPEIFLLQLKSTVQFTQGCLWDLQLEPAEWGICFDVLEHLPEEKVDAVLKGMSRHMKRGGLFSIYLAEDQFGETIGEKLHLTIRPAPWWLDKLSRHFSLHKELLNDETKLVIAVKPVAAQ